MPCNGAIYTITKMIKSSISNFIVGSFYFRIESWIRACYCECISCLAALAIPIFTHAIFGFRVSEALLSFDLRGIVEAHRMWGKLLDRYHGHVEYQCHNARRYTYCSDINTITNLNTHLQIVEWIYKRLKYFVSYSISKYTMLSHQDDRCYYHIHMNPVGHGILAYIHVCSIIRLLTNSQNQRCFLPYSTSTHNGYNAI